MKEKILKTAELIRSEIEELSDRIYAEPELGNQEFKSSKLHVQLLEKYGFKVEMPYMGVATGFRAEYCSSKPGPAVCYMAEYDALPGVGHGCGHNMLGATSTAAGILLSKFVEEAGGKVVVLGTPAEETCGAKVAYAREGVFEDIDVVMIDHPGVEAHERSGSSLALTTVEFTFHGRTAHAASDPEDGINALDAVTITLVAVGLLRQQMKRDGRIHGIVSEGGEACNVIPDRTVLRFYVRAERKKYMNELLEKVKNCARGAALATGCTVDMQPFELEYDDLMTNESLQDLFSECLEEFGAGEIRSAHAPAGSVDAGNVSYKCPTIHPYFPITPKQDMPGHSREFAECTQTQYAKDSMMQTACAMALAGYRVITQPDLLGKIRHEFEDSIK